MLKPLSQNDSNPFRICPTGIAGYLSAGVLLHAITVVEGAVILVAALIPAHPLKVPMLAMVCMAALFTQLDARSRFQEFKRVRDQLARYGPDRRIFRPVSASRCQRDAALAAARQLGHDAACRSVYRSMGYRWYHLLPDFLRRRPGYLLSPAFLRTTFFLPAYIARCPADIPGRKRIFSPVPAASKTAIRSASAATTLK